MFIISTIMTSVAVKCGIGITLATLSFGQSRGYGTCQTPLGNEIMGATVLMESQESGYGIYGFESFGGELRDIVVCKDGEVVSTLCDYVKF